MSRVYLSGRLHKCTYEEAEGWRDKATQLLGKENVHNPKWIKTYEGLDHNECIDLVNSDLDAIAACEVFFLNAWSPGWGSGCELRAAHEEQKVIVVVASGEISPWIRAHATHIVSTVEDGCRWIAARLKIELNKPPKNIPGSIPYITLSGVWTGLPNYYEKAGTK